MVEMRTRAYYRKHSKNISDLPLTVLEKIFEKLDLKSLYNLGQIDTSLRNRSNDFIESQVRVSPVKLKSIN